MKHPGNDYAGDGQPEHSPENREVKALLAASAIAHGCTLVTRNVADVARSGVPLINPFDPLDGP
jgi:toxin FitB